MNERRSATRAALLDAAERVAIRDGVARLTLAAVAAEAGVTKQGVLYHFATMDELVFTLFIRGWREGAQTIHDAVARAKDGPAALEAIISTFVRFYAPRLEVFRLITQHCQLYDAGIGLSAEQRAEIAVINDLLYAEAERKLQADQRAGRLPRTVSPRRLAVAAHAAAMGLLGIKALAERFDGPLRHSDEALIREICGAFRRACQTHEP